MRKSVALIVIFLLLLSAAGGVLFYLPAYLDSSPLPDSSQPIEMDDDSTVSQTRKTADNLRQKFLQQSELLEKQGINVWGDQDYQRILDQGKQAETLLNQRQIKSAITLYKQAVMELEQLDHSRSQRLDSAIAAGENSLVTNDSATALVQFTLALSIDPENSTALAGINSAKSMDQWQILIESGQELENKRDFYGAVTAYRKAQLLAPDNAKIKLMLTQAEKMVITEQFNQAMSQGFAAMDKNNYSLARESFQNARAIKPDSSIARDAIKRVSEQQTVYRINRYREEAEGFEHQELWQDAMNSYQAALELDANLEFARAGKKRSVYFHKLHQRLDSVLNRPERLSSDNVFQISRHLLTEAETVAQSGPELKKKTERLEKQLRDARIPIPVVLESDGNTEVAVYKVGMLGRFTTLTLDLFPGLYTAVGSCPGYQDIRHEFKIIAGKIPAAISIRCEEMI